jgi:tetratricopeptide (TPR) repeat protein
MQKGEAMRVSILVLPLAVFLCAGCGLFQSKPKLEESAPPMDTSPSAKEKDLREKAGKKFNEEGLVCCQKEDYAKAADLFQKAVRFQPEVPAYHNNLGRAYYWLGEHDLAIQELKEACRLGSEDAGSRANLGDVYRQKENYAEAIRCYHEALQLDPQLARVHYELGNLYLKRNQLEGAEFRLNRAIELDPGFDKALLARAILYHMTHRDAQALRDVRELEGRGFEVKRDLKNAILDRVEAADARQRYRPGN